MRKLIFMELRMLCSWMRPLFEWLQPSSSPVQCLESYVAKFRVKRKQTYINQYTLSFPFI